MIGNINNLSAGDVGGSIYCSGNLGHAKVRNLTGLLAAGIDITTLNAVNITGATILVGANLGADGQLGGAGTDADTFGAGLIGTIHSLGTIDSSFIGAGVNPVDGTFGNANDKAAGAGLIKLIIAKGGASNTKFEASAFGKARLPTKVDPATDGRFVVLH